MTNLELRVFRLETRLAALERILDALATQLGTIAQNQWTGTTPGSGVGGAASNFLVCSPTGSLPAASGNPGTGVPGGPLAAQNVYRVNAGAWSLLTSTASIYNPMTSATVASKGLVVLPNADGTYSAVTQSC
jgi:hypothetical protein